MKPNTVSLTIVFVALSTGLVKKSIQVSPQNPTFWPTQYQGKQLERIH